MTLFQTRILVTHSVTFLPQVDFIVVLKEGRISELGDYKSLIQQDGDFAEFLRTYLNELDSDSSDEGMNADLKMFLLTIKGNASFHGSSDVFHRCEKGLAAETVQGGFIKACRQLDNCCHLRHRK